MPSLPFTTAILRFPRRNPLCLLVLLIPLSLALYITFSPYGTWPANRIIPLRPNPTLTPSAPPTPPAHEEKPTEDAPTQPHATILLVSAFFPLSTSKHAMQAQTAQLARFLGRVTTDVYMYTTPDLAPMIRALRGALPLTLNTSFASPFDVPPLEDKRSAYDAMRALDRSRGPHVPEAYAAQMARPFFLAEALRRVNSFASALSSSSSANTQPYEYFFWLDPEAFTDAGHPYSRWPDAARVEEVWEQGRRESGQRAEEVLFLQIASLPHVSMLLWKDNMGPIENEFSQDTFFGGKAKTVLWFERAFYAYHDYYLTHGAFVGSFPSLTNALFLLHPERIITVFPRDPAAPSAFFGLPAPLSTSSGPEFQEATRDILGDCGDLSEYYQFFLAGWEEQDRARARWDAQWRWDFWRWSWWARERHSCRVTRVLAMEWLLRRPFGEAWRPPTATVQF